MKRNKLWLWIFLQIFEVHDCCIELSLLSCYDLFQNFTSSDFLFLFMMCAYSFCTLQKADSFNTRWSHNSHYQLADGQVYTRVGWSSTHAVVCCFSSVEQRHPGIWLSCWRSPHLGSEGNSAWILSCIGWNLYFLKPAFYSLPFLVNFCIIDIT